MIAISLALLGLLSSTQATPPAAPPAPAQAAPATPAAIVAAAPADAWQPIEDEDVLVMELAPDARGRARRVVLQLMPAPFATGHVANIRRLAAAGWWDGTSINRVQDNYVVQWGDATEKKPLPSGLVRVPEADYVASVAAVAEAQRSIDPATFARVDAAGKRAIAGSRTDRAPNGWHDRDAFAEWVELHQGWPLASQGEAVWPVHCYGMVGVGRNESPDTGTGAELYTVIGHAPRHLDRNIALVGRVIEGIEHLSSLPRGSGALGFYERPEERVTIASIRLASALPEGTRPRFEYLATDSDSFARYADARANRRDSFFIKPAGGVDICNLPVPIRAAKGG